MASGINPSSLQTPRGNETARTAQWLYASLLILWGASVLRPQMAYPLTGAMIIGCLVVLCAALVMMNVRGRKLEGTLLKKAASSGREFTTSGKLIAAQAPANAWARPTRPASAASIAGALFIAYVWGQWLAQGAAYAGLEQLGALLCCAGAFVVARGSLARVAWDAAEKPQRLVEGFLVGLAMAAALAAVHGMMQYFVFYESTLRAMEAELGQRPLTELETGLLHHLRLRRVGGTWGDPNLFGGFLALGLLSALAVAGAPTQWMANRVSSRTRWVLALAVAATCAFGIVLTGSRGAVLDVVLGLVLFGVIALWRGRGKRNTTGRAHPQLANMAAIILALILSFGVTAALRAQGPAEGADAAVSTDNATPDTFIERMTASLGRSDTVRERANYLHVGLLILRDHPVFGAGLGGVNLLYGQYKPAAARESKYLHNWPMQIAAELGLVGLGLALMFLAALMYDVRRGRVYAQSAGAGVLVLTTVCLFDGLLQLSYNSREFLMGFGLLAGTLSGLAAHGAMLRQDTAEPASAPRGEGAAWFTLRNVAIGFLACGLAAHGVVGMLARDYDQGIKAAMESEDTAAAMASARAAMALWPPSPYAMMAAARIFEGRSGPVAALPMMERAVAAEPRSASLRAELAALQDLAGQHDAARRNYDIALLLYPTNADHRYALAKHLEKRGDRVGAIREATLAVEYAYVQKPRYEAYLNSLKRTSSPGNGGL